MNAVFHCPRCNTPLGTTDDPKPEPLPPCPNCGWVRAVPSNVKFTPGYLGTALVMLALGLGAGWVAGHSLLVVLFALIAAGPLATVAIARTFSSGWFAFNLCHVAGLLGGMFWFNDGETFAPDGWRFPVSMAVGSLLLGWFVGWLKHSD